MIVLGIDTSAYVNAVGLVDGDRVLADAAFPAATDSLEQIVNNIDSVLRGAGLTLADVGGIGVGLGPGSWTGIRVGVTVGKVLSYAARKPVVGVSTLEVLAFGGADKDGKVCAVIGAGTGNAVYAACYRRRGENFSQDGGYYSGSVSEISYMIKTATVVASAGAARLLDEAGIKENKVEAMPSGAIVARLAVRRLEKGDHDDVLALSPLYLKESTAKPMVRPRYSAGSL